MVTLDEKREVAQELQTQYHLSARQACEQVQLPRSTAQYQKQKTMDDGIIQALTELVEKHPGIGFWMCYHRLRRKGHGWNHKRVYRVYTQLRLNQRRRMKRRLPARVKQQLFQPQDANQVWSIDFMYDTLWDGRSYRLLNVLDDYNRQILAIEADTSLPVPRLLRVLEQLKASRGLPQIIRVDNGPEFISHKLEDWCQENKVSLLFIQPGKPTQNAFIERFNGSFRRELLNAYIFRTLDEVREKTQEYMQDYNENRPHKALRYHSPTLK